MSSRGRRSCGDGVGLNPAMIYLLDLARLRKELESRGLDTKGNKQTLADRLEEAIRLGKPGDSEKSVEHSPAKSTPTKRSVNRTAQNKLKMVENLFEIDSSPQVNNSLDESADKTSKNGMSTRKRKLPDDDKKTATPKFVKFVWATEAPVEAIEKVEPAVVAENTPIVVENTNESFNTPTSAKKSKIKSKPKSAKENITSEHNSSIGTTTRAMSAAAATTPSTNLSLSPATTNIDVFTTTSTAAASSPVNTLISPAGVVVKESVEMECTSTADSTPAESASVKVSMFAKSVTTTSILSSTDSASVAILTSVVSTPTALTKQTTVKSDTKIPSTSTKAVMTAVMSTATPTIVTTVVPSTPTSITNAVNITSFGTKSVPQKATPTYTTKTPQLPKRVIAGSVDLLDNIFSQQNQLLADKYKSEQEKAMEKHLFELQKRRFSAAGSRVSGISAEKRPFRSAEGGGGQNSIPFTPDDDYLPAVVGFNNRDPLNLRDLKPLGTDTSHASCPVSAKNDRDVPSSSRMPSSMTREVSVSRRNPSDGFIPHEKPISASSKLSQSEFLLPPPPPPPVCLVPPPPPKPHPKLPTAITNSVIADIVIPPPPPRLPKSQPTNASTSRVEPSSVVVIPPPPPRLPKPHSAVSADIETAVIVIPPPPPRLPKSQPANVSKESESVVVVPPPPPPRVRSPAMALEASKAAVTKSISPPPTVEVELSEAAIDLSLLSTTTEVSSGATTSPTTASITSSPVSTLSSPVNALPILVKESVDVTSMPLVADEDLAILESAAPAPTDESAEVKSAPLTVVEVSVTFESSSVNAAGASANAPVKVLAAVESAPFSPVKSPTSEENVANTTFSDMEFVSIETITATSSTPTSTDSTIDATSTSIESITSTMISSVWTKMDITSVASAATSMTTTTTVLSTPMSVSSAINTTLAAALQTEQVDTLENISSQQDQQLAENDQLDGEESMKKNSNDNENNTTLTEGDNTTVKQEPEDSEHDISALLLKDPKALLRRATDVLKRINESENIGSEDLSTSRYDQLELDTSDYIMEEEEKPLPDFHGEPVPDDEDDDDALFEIAAGLRPANKKRDSVPMAAEDEPLPDDEFIELDYYNADMNIKAAANNKWLIDPDNQDGFALMWGGVKSNYGILVSDDFHTPSSSSITERLATRRDSVGSTNDEDVIEVMNTANSDDGHARPSCSQGMSTSRASKLLPKRVAFEIKVVEFLSLKHVPFEELEPHDVRIGWSAAGTSNMLGESNQSYMYCSNARKANANIFTDYGDPFHVNDVVTTVLDFEKHEIRYYKNKEKMGVAFSNVDFPVGTVVFPHIATKNCKVLVNFGYDDLPETENADDWNLPDEELPDEEEESVRTNDEEQEDEYNGAVMIGLLQRRSGLLVPSRRPPLDKTHCTVIAMVGLPGAGKSTWVKQYLFDHPDEHWILFNTDTILNAMTVNGISRRRVHQGRWDMVMGLTAKALNRSLQMACRRRHNYIIDQTNVSREARKRKLTQFTDFQRKCVVILPPDDELERRLLRQSRQEGSAGPIPAEAMLELKGVTSIPCTETEPIEDVFFVEPPMERLNEAIEQVKKYNEEGRPWIRKQHPTQKPESIISDCRNDNSNPWMSNQQQSQNQRSSHNSTF